MAALHQWTKTTLQPEARKALGIGLEAVLTVCRRIRRADLGRQFFSSPSRVNPVLLFDGSMDSRIRKFVMAHWDVSLLPAMMLASITRCHSI
jgi:hypothetical protein